MDYEYIIWHDNDFDLAYWVRKYTILNDKKVQFRCIPKTNQPSQIINYFSDDCTKTVMQYIKYAQPGLVAYILFLLTLLVVLVIDIRKRKTVVSKAVLIGAVLYFFNLWWVDALQTLKFVYILIAIFYASRLESKDRKVYSENKLRSHDE